MTHEAFVEELGRLEAEAMSDHRLDMCGCWRSHFSYYSGSLVNFEQNCNNYHKCPKCNDRTASLFLAQLRNTGKRVYAGFIREGKLKSVFRRWNRWGVNWLRLPISNIDSVDGVDRPYRFFQRKALLGDSLIFFDDKRALRDDPKAVPLDRLHLDCLKSAIQEALRRVPKGRRRSGKLGLSPPREPDPDAQIISVEVIVHKATDRQMGSALKATLEHTKDLNPHTATEAEGALQKRMDTFKEELKVQGVRILESHRETRRVSPEASIDWNCDTASAQTKLFPLTKEALRWHRSGVPIGQIKVPVGAPA